MAPASKRNSIWSVIVPDESSSDRLNGGDTCRWGALIQIKRCHSIDGEDPWEMDNLRVEFWRPVLLGMLMLLTFRDA